MQSSYKLKWKQLLGKAKVKWSKVGFKDMEKNKEKLIGKFFKQYNFDCDENKFDVSSFIDSYVKYNDKNPLP